MSHRYNWKSNISGSEADLLATVEDGYNPVHCQSCGEELTGEIFERAFCSEKCQAEALAHCKGSVAVIIIKQRDPDEPDKTINCLLMVADATRGQLPAAEFSGGGLDKEEGEDEAACCAREMREEIGLRTQVTASYIKRNALRRLLWYQRRKKETIGTDAVEYELVNYNAFVLKIENFNVGLALSAIRSRKGDAMMPKCWTEIVNYWVIPLHDLKKFATDEVPTLIDIRKKRVNGISPRWYRFLKHEEMVDTLIRYTEDKSFRPWRIVKSGEAYVWNASQVKPR